LFNICVPADLDAEGFAHDAFKRGGVSHGGPQLQLGVPGRSQSQERIVAAIVKLQPRNRL
jgi:hypothetical protein